MAAWHSSTGVSPRPMLMGASRNALWAFNARVSLPCLYVVAHKLPYLFYGLVFVAHLFRRGPDLRTCNRVMAHRPYGSAQTGMYPSALCCAGGLPPGFLFQSAASAQGKRKQGKGKLFPLPGLVLFVHADDRMDELDFQSVLHVLVHPDTGLTV